MAIGKTLISRTSRSKKSYHSNKAYGGCQSMLLYSSIRRQDNKLVWTKSISWVIDELFPGQVIIRHINGCSLYCGLKKASNVKVTSMVLSQSHSCPVASVLQNLGKNIILIQESAIMMLPWYSKVQKMCAYFVGYYVYLIKIYQIGLFLSHGSTKWHSVD